MFKLKNFKRNFRSSSSEKRSLTSNEDASSISSSSRYANTLDQNQVQLLARWLNQLNKEKSITITDQNDIVILPEGKTNQTQQIFVNCNDISSYMEAQINNEPKTIYMTDLARILLLFGYVHESSGQLSYASHTIAVGNDELNWLKSIVHKAQPDRKSSQTRVELFDGENIQLISIPYEHLAPTNNTEIVANYLFKNGQVRYDVQTGAYAYRYIQPDILLDEKIKSSERLSQHQFLSFHIKQIHVEQRNKRVQLEFRYDPNHYLILPIRWYEQLFNHNFDRDYIIDILLANGGTINSNTFVFMGNTYSLQEPKMNQTNYLKPVNLSLSEKYELIRRYIYLIIQMDGVRQDQTNDLFVLENDADKRKLYFTPEHSDFIKQNQFQKHDVIQILAKYSLIKQDQYQKWYLDYNNQFIRLPNSILPSYQSNNQISINTQQILSSNNNTEQDIDRRYDYIIDYMCRHGLVTWDNTENLIKLHFADQTLRLPINHLRSIIDPRIISSSSYSNTDGVLPFTSRQLSQWLRNNSYITQQNTT